MKRLILLFLFIWPLLGFGQIQTINVGTANPNDRSGDITRNAFIKCNNNFQYLYSTGTTRIDSLIDAGFLTETVWGSVTGTMADQSDLITALGLKASIIYVDSKITQTITDGSTTTSPSEDKVFDVLEDKVDEEIIFNNQGASYTLVLSDQNKIVTISNGSANTVTIPTHASVPYPTGTVIYYERLGAGQTTITLLSGVTATFSAGVTTDPGQNVISTFIKTGTNAWNIQNGSAGGGSSGDALTTNPLSQFASTTSAQLATVLSDESGSGAVVYSSITDGKQSTLTNSAGLAAALSDESGTGTVTYTSYVDAKVADAINNGTTTIAPSQNVVFDELALKAPLASPTFTGTPAAPTATGGTSTTQLATTAYVLTRDAKEYIIPCSDITTVLTTGTAKAYFRMPFAMTVTEVRASVKTAQTSGSILTIDINESGTTILSTKLTIDNSENTSVTAATAHVISDAAIAADAEITFDIDQVGASPVWLHVTLLGYRTN